jgi:hypothetical protein
MNGTRMTVEKFDMKEWAHSWSVRPRHNGFPLALEA